jgi:predicted transcriptional regulator
MTVQYIEKDGRREYAIIPIDEYERLVAAAEMVDDILTYDNIKSKARDRDNESIPGEIVNRLLTGANPIQVWREFRGLTQQQLAERIELSESALQQFESGLREAPVHILSRIANALHIMIDDITSWHTDN